MSIRMLASIARSEGRSNFLSGMTRPGATTLPLASPPPLAAGAPIAGPRSASRTREPPSRPAREWHLAPRVIGERPVEMARADVGRVENRLPETRVLGQGPVGVERRRRRQGDVQGVADDRQRRTRELEATLQRGEVERIGGRCRRSSSARRRWSRAPTAVARARPCPARAGRERQPFAGRRTPGASCTCRWH